MLLPQNIRQKTIPKLSGFSLIEMLAVIAIISIMAAVLQPVFSSLNRSRNLRAAADSISGMIDLARSEAMTKNTYVWVGFASSADGTQLIAIVTRSLDGTPTLSGSNTRLVMQTRPLQNILLTDANGLTAPTQNILNAASITTTNTLSVLGSGATISPGLSLNVAGNTISFSQFIMFTPQGEVVATTTPSQALPPTPFTNRILIGLRNSVRGNAIVSDVDSIGLVLYGGTGHTVLFRP